MTRGWRRTILLIVILICGFIETHSGPVAALHAFLVGNRAVAVVCGREFFRAKVTYYTATTFEDRVIFVRDVEKCLDRLEYWDQQVIVRVILQEHSQEQTARILQCNRKTVQRRLPLGA